jgi:hypothetical protein
LTKSRHRFETRLYPNHKNARPPAKIASQISEIRKYRVSSTPIQWVRSDQCQPRLRALIKPAHASRSLRGLSARDALKNAQSAASVRSFSNWLFYSLVPPVVVDFLRLGFTRCSLAPRRGCSARGDWERSCLIEGSRCPLLGRASPARRRHEIKDFHGTLLSSWPPQLGHLENGFGFSERRQAGIVSSWRI